MKIIHVITAFGIGGAEKLLLNIINRQIIEHEVHLVYFKSKDNLIPLVDKKVEIKQIPLSLLIVKKLNKYYKEVNPDIIHTHLGHADLLGIWSARKLNIKIFSTMHNIYFKKNLLDQVIFGIYRILFLKIVKNSYVISISKSVENHILKVLKLPKKRSLLLFNAIPSKEYSFKKNENEIIKLLFVGRLEKQKSIETLLKSIRNLVEKERKNNYELIIVGDGKLRNNLEQLTKQLQIKDLVKFEGEKMDIDGYYNSADIFILPSIWEGFGIVILEAFRAKLAVIASNIEGPAELISDNENGLLFEPKNHIELSEKIRLLIEDKALRKEIAQNGYKTFREEYHIDKYVEKLNMLYTKSLNE